MSWYWILLIALATLGVAYLGWRLLAKKVEYIPSSSLEFFDSLESHFASVENFTIHYLQTGKGPHLVLLHGIGASTFTWRFLIPLFSKKYTVTIVDIPGFGKSSKDPVFSYGLDEQSQRLEKFLTQIGIHQARLIGSSMGGALALWMAKKAPDRFIDVIAISPATNKSLIPFKFSQIHKASKWLTWSLNRSTMKMIYSKVVADQTLVNDETIERYLEPFLDKKKSIPTFLKATELIRDERLPGELQSISSRVLLLYGKKDEIVSKKIMKELKDILKSARYLEKKEAGHHIMEDAPQWVYECSIHFFEEHKDV